jgi:RND family efflux transporter MFP subunit
MSRHTANAGALSLALALASLPLSCHRATEAAKEPDPIPVKCVTPHAEAIDESVSLRGRVQPPPGGDLPVASQVGGRIVNVAVHEGQHVAKGDVIANVDDVSTRDAAKQAEAALEQAQSNEENAKRTLERAKALVARGIAAKQELDDANARAEAARAAVASATAGTDLAKRTLARVQVHSTFDGIVTRVWRGPGAIVDGTAATPIIQLASTNAVEFVAEATEEELGRVKEGQSVKGSFEASHAPFEGLVRARASALDPVTGLGVVRITLAGDTTVPIGAFGQVSILTAHREGVPVLPAAALRGAVADGAQVAVCKDGKIELHTLKIGWRDDQKLEVLAGIAPTDKVAIEHVLGLDDGTAITESK